MRYQDVYPEEPLINSHQIRRIKAIEVVTLEYFESQPGEMPYEIFEQHHVLINLREKPHRLEHWRAGEHFDFTYLTNEIIITPAGIQSGWKWHASSKVIVATLEPDILQKFIKDELQLKLQQDQLESAIRIVDEDITQAATVLKQALESSPKEIILESYARVFLIKLIQGYGLVKTDHDDRFNRITAFQYRSVIQFIENNYSENISVETLAEQVNLSASHFSRAFKQAMGTTPYQFVMLYRVERAKTLLKKNDKPLIQIAEECGFSDQAHFAKVFNQLEGMTPKVFRKSL